MTPQPATEIVMDALAGLEPAQHAERLIEIMSTAAAALQFTVGQVRACETTYRIADQLAGVQ